MLIQAGADLNLTEQHGFTPLHLASWIGNEEMVQLLLEFRADLNRVRRGAAIVFLLRAASAQQFGLHPRPPGR